MKSILEYMKYVSESQMNFFFFTFSFFFSARFSLSSSSTIALVMEVVRVAMTIIVWYSKGV